MANRVDLNADMGEGFGRWSLGDDASLLDIVTSANIACGWHAGDANVMAETMRLAVRKGVGIGAHPGFGDLQGFGRRRLSLSEEELRNLVTYQLGAARAMATAAGGRVRHLKLHGALANMASEDEALAYACYRAALRIQPDIVIMVLAGTAMERVVRDLDCAWVGEIFADRTYNDDATLVDRAEPGAVVHDAPTAAERLVNMLSEEAIITRSGLRLPCRIDTICLHGDTPGAVVMARRIKERLTDAGIEVRQF
ncbi:MAG: 5-oxoprolinase subunit PxpA [Pseudomonadota bacterium]